MSIDGALVVGSDVAVGGLVVGADGVDVGAADGEGVAGGGRLPDDGQNSSRAGVKFSCNYCNVLEQMRKRERNIQDNVRRTIYTTTTSRQIEHIQEQVRKHNTLTNPAHPITFPSNTV
jgi:hypothetical protein